MVDDSPDMSWLGEYSDTATSEYSIDREHSMARDEYQYFNPSANYKGETPENMRKYVLRDYERMESLNRGDWCFMGVRAEAEIVLGGIRQTIASGGLWGIESDSNKSYFTEIETEQLAELREQLHIVGFNKRAISVAFKNVEREEQA
jgi:hypothetical protein